MGAWLLMRGCSRIAVCARLGGQRLLGASERWTLAESGKLGGLAPLLCCFTAFHKPIIVCMGCLHCFMSANLVAEARAPYPRSIDFFILSAIWGASFLFMRMAAAEFGIWATSAVRVGIAALVLLPLALARGLLPEMRAHWRVMAVVGLFNAAIPFACFAFALLHIPTGVSSILNATTPLFTAVVAWLWLGQRPSLWRVLGLGIGFSGAALLAMSRAPVHAGSGLSAGDRQQWLAMGACLCATLCYGMAACISRKYLAGVSSLAAAAGSNFSAMVALLLPAIWWGPRSMPGAPAWAAIVAVGVLCTALAYVLYYRLIQTAGPAISSTVTYVVPVFALLYGYLFLGETVTPAMLGYGAMILLGTALANLLPAARRSARI